MFAGMASRLQDFPLKIRLIWKRMTVTNTPAYYREQSFTVESITQWLVKINIDILIWNVTTFYKSIQH